MFSRNPLSKSHLQQDAAARVLAVQSSIHNISDIKQRELHCREFLQMEPAMPQVVVLGRSSSDAPADGSSHETQDDQPDIHHLKD